MRRLLYVLFVIILSCKQVIEKKEVPKISIDDSLNEDKTFIDILTDNEIHYKYCEPDRVFAKQNPYNNGSYEDYHHSIGKNNLLVSGKKLSILGLDSNRKFMPVYKGYSLNTIFDTSDTLNRKKYYLLGLQTYGENHYNNNFFLFEEKGKLLQNAFNLNFGGEMGYLRTDFAIFYEKDSIKVHRLSLEPQTDRFPNHEKPFYTYSVEKLYVRNSKIVIDTISLEKKYFESFQLMEEDVNKILIKNKITNLE